MTAASGITPPADPTALAVFGRQLPLAQRYADLLSRDGFDHGLLGPRERDRLWPRHLINSALVTELLPEGARVVDVGSGAGLPGLAMACRRVDLRVDLVESMARRVEFLNTAVDYLELAGRVRVVLGRAESTAVRNQVGDGDWVTARAVAPLGRLAGWCLPLVHKGGRLLALKGERAADEVREQSIEVQQAGGVIEEIVLCGRDITSDPAKVVVVRRR